MRCRRRPLPAAVGHRGTQTHDGCTCTNTHMPIPRLDTLLHASHMPCCYCPTLFTLPSEDAPYIQDLAHLPLSVGLCADDQQPVKQVNGDAMWRPGSTRWDRCASVSMRVHASMHACVCVHVRYWQG